MKKYIFTIIFIPILLYALDSKYCYDWLVTTNVKITNDNNKVILDSTSNDTVKNTYESYIIEYVKLDNYNFIYLDSGRNFTRVSKSFYKKIK